MHNEPLEGNLCHDVIKTDLCSNNCPLDSANNKSSCASYFMNINLYKKNNSSIPLCLNVAPMHDREGNIVGFIENFRPMSEAIKAIESLKQNNILLAQEKDKVDTIIESLADGVFTVDQKLRITSFSKGMENLTGIRESDAIGAPCHEILNSDNCSGNCPFANTLERGYGLANVRERIAGKDGDTLPVFISTAFLKDSSGNMELIATVKDLSEIEKLRKDVNERYYFSNIIGKSSQMQEIFELIEVLSSADCAILIEGESGTGKELVSRAIHHESHRRNRPFVKVNCSAIVEGLFESELFGHIKGAFSGAIRDKIGKFELADEGILFLDEIADMPYSLQPKLLRVLQEKEFQRVGGNQTHRADVRIIAAASEDLKRVVNAGIFRDDLFYRLNVVPLHIPPLRDRREDIPLLLEHFFQKAAKELNRSQPSISEEAEEALMHYSYPGNVRELINIVERLLVMCPNGNITAEDLPEEVRTDAKLSTESNKLLRQLPDGGARLQEVEKELILKTLAATSGNKVAAARMLGITRRRLYLRLSQYGL
jgi:PAS domain S-box-containing protein